MKIEQISIFMENKSGRMAVITDVLGSGGINIRALSLADTSDFGVLRLIVDNPTKGLEILRNNSFTVSKTGVVGVIVPDRPGGLTSILSVIDKNSINIEYMYAFSERSSANSVIIFRFDDIEAAINVLKQNSITLYSNDNAS